MFGLSRKKTSYEQEGRALYEACLASARDEQFYTHYNVPDTFDGRFEMLAAHVCLVIHRLQHAEGGPDAGQALFDITFAACDQMLREMGIGDMGVPKHMRKMMKALNGRMHVYHDALERGDAQALQDAISRNVYGTLKDAGDDKAAELGAVMIAVKNDLQAQNDDDITSGDVVFKWKK